MNTDEILVGITIPPTAFRTSTTGKPASTPDTPEEEEVYRALVIASGQAMALEDIRLMRRIFDRADLDKNRFVDRDELRMALKSVDDGILASRVLQEILLDDTKTDPQSAGDEPLQPPHDAKGRRGSHARRRAERQILRDTRWSFPAFVFLLRAKLTDDERLKLMTMEEEFLRDMGVDADERLSIQQFREGREERRRSSLVQQFLHQADSSSPTRSTETSQDLNSSTRRRASVPNDVDEYKREFGLS